MKNLTLASIGNALAILLVLLSLLTMIFFGYRFYADPTKSEWANVFTGAGAVLAASVSALVAFRSVALVEESQQPYPYPYIDIKSRYGLSLIKIKNAGGSAAHRVYFEWDGGTPCIRQDSQNKAQPIHFAADAAHAITVLMPGDEQASMLGVHYWIAQQLRANQQELKGNMVFQDVKGHTHRTPFFIDTSFYEWALEDETELLKAQRAMTELPAALAEINKSLEHISRGLKA